MSSSAPTASATLYRRTKRDITSSQPSGHNHRNFTLLGDPSWRLALARMDAEVTSLTHTLGNPVDTMWALAVVRVNGRVMDENAQTLTEFNGVVIPTVFDKKSTIYTLANWSDPPGLPFPFQLRKNILYRGRATVSNGLFSFTFVVPKDINYQNRDDDDDDDDDKIVPYGTL